MIKMAPVDVPNLPDNIFDSLKRKDETNMTPHEVREQRVDEVFGYVSTKSKLTKDDIRDAMDRMWGKV